METGGLGSCCAVMQLQEAWVAAAAGRGCSMVYVRHMQRGAVLHPVVSHLFDDDLLPAAAALVGCGQHVVEYLAPQAAVGVNRLCCTKERGLIQRPSAGKPDMLTSLLLTGLL